MKICFIGKFPPIPGGVSSENYWFAHELAEAGHEIHVVTNANEAFYPYRMKMLATDWHDCEKSYVSGGFVKVHWTNDDIKKQYHVPNHNAFVTKLSSKALKVIRENAIDVIFGYYIEPYGIASYIASLTTNVPYVIKHAGSDIGRLWKQDDFYELYQIVLKRAKYVLTSKIVAKEIINHGIKEEKLRLGVRSPLPKIFNTNKSNKDEFLSYVNITALINNKKTIGIYGKPGMYKGTLEIIKAVALLKRQGYDFQLILVGMTEDPFQKRIEDLIKFYDLYDTIYQLPFLPNWRIPAFIKYCDVLCYLENDFPIKFHMPIIFEEIVACGKALICSAEIKSKQFNHKELNDGENCFIVNNVANQIELLEVLTKVLTLSHAKLIEVGLNAASYYESLNDYYKSKTNVIDIFHEAVETRS